MKTPTHHLGQDDAGSRLRRWALRVLPFVFLALPAREPVAASFGVPPAGGGAPRGYFMLASQDAVDPVVSDALGDVAHFMVLTIEAGTPGIQVDLHDPGLFNPSLGLTQLDINLASPAATPAEIRYTLFGPDPGTGAPDTLLATRIFGVDTIATDWQLVNLYTDAASRPGLYHLTVHMVDGVAAEQDIAVFGVSVPGHSVYTLNLTAGEANEGFGQVTEPVRVYPYIVTPSPGTDAIGAVCGAQFITYDLEAVTNGTEPPIADVISGIGFSFPRRGASGDARWRSWDVGGVNPGQLDSSDHGIWSWEFSQLDQGQLEDCFSNLSPARDFNIFSTQILNYAAGMRDFLNWKDLPDRPPFIVFNADNPRRIYLPNDAGAAPAKEVLNHRADIVAGYPVLALGEASSLEIVLTLDNPTTYDLSGIVGETRISANPSITDPVIASMSGGLIASIDPGDGRHVLLAGDVAAGMTGEVRITVDILPDALGRFFLTGDGSDFISAASPTMVRYQTPFTAPGSFELPEERQGPICAIEYEVVIPPCVAVADIAPSAIRTCPGTDVILDGTGSQLYSCPGGVPIYQWSVNGAISQPFNAPDTITVRPYFNDTWQLEVACSTDPVNCIGSTSITFDLYPAPIIDVGPDLVGCLGDSFPLTAAISDGTPPYSNFRWSTIPPGEPGDGDTTQAINVAPTGTTTYTFATDDGQGCTGSDSVLVEVRKPTPTIVPAGPELCPAQSIGLTATPGFTAYAWSSNPAGEPGDGATTETVTVGVVGTTWTVTVTDDVGCTGQASVTTVAAPPLSPAIAPPDPRICLGGTATITADPGYATYIWSSVEDPSVNGLTTEAIDVGMDGATYTVTVTDVFGCSGTASVTLSVLPDPIPGAMNWSLRAAKSGADDLLLTWLDLPDPAGAYQVVSLDCDATLDGVCDQDPTPAAMAASPLRTDVAVGVQQLVEVDGLNRPSWLVFYKVRALSPCSLTPGPFGNE